MPLDQQDFILPETKPTTRELPDKLSDLILVALEDLEKAEASRRHEVRMAHWHEQQHGMGDNKCFVCFAGGVMAFSLNAPAGETVHTVHWGEAIRDKLYALNQVRIGAVQQALELMGHQKSNWPNEIRRTPMYELDAQGFKRCMHDLAGRLEAAGY